MNTRLRNPFLIFGLVAGLALVLIGQVAAQDFTLLHTFTDYDFDFNDVNANTDGIEPVSLIASGHTLYGTTYKGGPYGAGTVFRMNSDGTGFTNLYSFSQDTDINDGNFPVGNLVLSGETLYGATQSGGTNHNGTVFKINTDGSGLTILHKFSDVTDLTGTNSDGIQLEAGLILSGGTLYGTASAGGTYGCGTIFALNTNGAGFRTLYSFTATTFAYYGSNSDGAFPYASLVLAGDTLYGTTSGGGTNSNGTLFAINTNGTGFSVLHTFSAELGAEYTNSDGGEPAAGLVLSGDTLYGTAGFGGINGNGTVFALNTNGSGFTTLHGFSALVSGSNADGIQPEAGLILSGGTLYGTAYQGGADDGGTVFALGTNGTGFTTLHSFNDESDGGDLVAGLALINGALYGAARDSGTNDKGTLFSISLAPKLLMLSSGANMVLSWPTNTIGFTLESSTTLGASAVWTNVSQSPVVVNANNTVTNPVSGPQKFYRLSH